MSEYSHRHHYDDSSFRHHSRPCEQTIEVPHHHHRHDDDLSPRHLSREDRHSRTLDTEELDRHPPQHHHSPRGRDLIYEERPRSVDRPHHQHPEDRRLESPSFPPSDNITRSNSSREHQHHHHREIAFTEAEKAERREARKKRREKEERLEKAGLSWKQTAHNGGWIGCEVLGAVAHGF